MTFVFYTVSSKGAIAVSLPGAGAGPSRGTGKAKGAVLTRALERRDDASTLYRNR